MGETQSITLTGVGRADSLIDERLLAKGVAAFTSPEVKDLNAALKKADPPSADFVLEMPERRVGIEVTTVRSGDVASREGTQDKVLWKAQRLHTERRLETADVQVHFARDLTRAASTERLL